MGEESIFKFNIGDIVNHVADTNYQKHGMVVRARGIMDWGEGRKDKVYCLSGVKHSVVANDSTFFGAYLSEGELVPAKEE